MSTTKRARRHARESVLTPAQELELIIGPAGKSAFATDAARREAYRAHRDDLKRDNGRATWAWVEFEASGFFPHEGMRITKALARLARF